MSIMTRGVIAMPYKLAMHSDLNRRQFYSHAQVLLAESDQLKAENEALRKDADRYRWIRGRNDYEVALHNGENLDLIVDRGLARENRNG